MTKRDDRGLRSRAEATVARRSTKKVASSQLSAELEIHRVELELQNEELRSARVATEAALARYTEVFDFAPVGYAVLDAGRRIREINHAGASLLGVERARLISKQLAAYVGPGALSAFDALLIRAAAAPISVQAELELVRGAQSWAARVTVAALARDEPMLLVAFEDITDAQRRELDLARSEHALREANRHKDEFIAMLSHELRNPLAPIQTCVSVLRQLPEGSPPPASMLGILERSAQQLARLIDDLLDVTRITSGKIQLHRVPVELVGLVTGALADVKLGFDRHRLALETRIADGELWTLGDPVRLIQILTNLLTNAQKFTPDGGRVTVTLERRDGRAWIRVRDSGIGVEPSQIAGLFEPFVQGAQGLDRSRGGLGLGLAVARGLVELHGGRITMHSDGSGTGTEVSFYLPIELPNTAVARPATAASTGQRRVLIIEDHADSAESLQLLLEMEGHCVQVAGDGNAGLAMARRFVPEIVLCDLGLPGMDGFAVARAMRADPALHDRYLVAVSGYARPDDISSRARRVSTITSPSRSASRRSTQCSPRRRAGSTDPRPGVRQPVAGRPRIVGIEHVLARAGDPGAPGDRRDDRGPLADRGVGLDPAEELRADDRSRAIAIADLHLAARAHHRHPRRHPGSGRRAVDLAGLDRDGVDRGRHVILDDDRRRDLAERDVVPLGVGRVTEAELLVGRARDPDADLGELARLVGAQREAEAVRVDDGEAVAAVRGVDGQRAEPGDLEGGIEPVGERRHVAHGDPLGLAGAALRDDLDQPAGRLEHQAGLGLGHRDDAAVEQHRRHADRVRSRHRRRVLGLHDEKAELRARVLGGHDQIHVAEHAAARLVEHEVAQRLVAREEPRLFPQRVARRRRHAADDDVADLALGVTRHQLDHPQRSHARHGTTVISQHGRRAPSPRRGMPGPRHPRERGSGTSLAAITMEASSTEDTPMHAKAKLFGHPIHQMLIVFPLGLLATSLIFDIAYHATGNGRWADIAYVMIACGIIGGLVAAVFGLVDWLAIPGGTRAKRIGALHGIGNVVVVALFAISWLLRHDNPVRPGTTSLIFSILGVGLAVVTGWLGGELVDRLAVGVDEGAHVNAPSSLSGRPASEVASREVASRYAR